MAEDRSYINEDAPTKRQKTSNRNMDPRNNPYLQHMYADESSGDISNGYSTPPKRFSGLTGPGPLAKSQRHKTTAALARSVEDGQINPFTGEPFSNRYVSILRTRRDLPVHAQRYITWSQLYGNTTDHGIGTNSFRCTKSLRYWSSLVRLGLGRPLKFHNLCCTTTFLR
jgi:hypothetical protein